MVNRATNRLPLQISDASRKVLHNEFDPNEEDEEKEEKIEEVKEVKEVKEEKGRSKNK